MRVVVDNERGDLQQIDVGRVLELGSATDDDFCVDTDLRRISDVEISRRRHKNARKSFGGIFVVVGADGAVPGIHLAANVLLTAPVAAHQFGRVARHGSDDVNGVDVGVGGRDTDILPIDEEVTPVEQKNFVAVADSVVCGVCGADVERVGDAVCIDSGGGGVDFDGAGQRFALRKFCAGAGRQ